MRNEPGVVLTCSDPMCGCRLVIESPCPHGDTYKCACGNDFVEAESTARTTIL